MESCTSRIFFTTKSSLVGSFTHLHSTVTPTLSDPKKIFSESFLTFFANIIQQILYNKLDTEAWIKKAKMDLFSFRPLLALKLVMIVSSICLQVPNFSHFLVELLLGRCNVGYLLPKNFLSNLLKKRNGRDLRLNPEIIAEAFMSVDDPLVIVSSRNEIPRIHAPCAIFVDLTKSRDEIMSVLFATKNSQTSSNNVGRVAIPDIPCPNTPPSATLTENPVGGCKGELNLNWKVLEEISEAMNVKKGKSLSSLSVAATIKKELDKNIHTLTTALEDVKSCDEKDTTLVRRALTELKVLSSAFDTSQQKVETSGFMKNLQGFVESLQNSKLKIDDFLNHSVKSRDSMGGQVAVSKCNSTTEVEETVEAKNHNDDPPLEVVLENQSGVGNTRDAKNTNGKGNSKKKNKKGKGKKR